MAKSNQIVIFLIFFAIVVVLRQVAVQIVDQVHAEELERTLHKSSGSSTFRGGGGRGGGTSDQVCKAYKSQSLFEQAEQDFKRYHAFKYSPQVMQYSDFCETVAKNYACLTVQIIDGRIYVKHFFPGYQSRHRGTLHGLYRVAQRFGNLPNAQFVIEVTDGVFGAVDLPIFVITRLRNNPNGVLYPDFTFYSWPEAVCPPERSHAHGFLMSLYKKEKDQMDSNPEAYWTAKKDTMFWRGGVVGNPIRKQVVDSVKGPDIDIQFMQWHSTSLTGVNGAPGCVGLIDHCRYRYLAFLQGNTYSSRLKYQLLCGSCVFASRQPWIEWWTQLLTPGEDLVEVADDWSDATQKLAAVKSSPDGGRQIAKNGQQKTLNILSEDAVDCYWLRLIELAAEHLPPPPVVDIEKLPATMKPIEDALLYSNDVLIGSRDVKGPVIPVR